jgi:hypothetical protein
MDFADYELFINDDFELAVYNRDIDSVVVDVHERRAVLEHFRDRLDAELGQQRVDDLDDLRRAVVDALALADALARAIASKALALADALAELADRLDDALDTARNRDR